MSSPSLMSVLDNWAVPKTGPTRIANARNLAAPCLEFSPTRETFGSMAMDR